MIEALKEIHLFLRKTRTEEDNKRFAALEDKRIDDAKKYTESMELADKILMFFHEKMLKTGVKWCWHD